MNDALELGAVAPQPPSMWRLLLLALLVPVLLVAMAWWIESEYAATENRREQAQASYDRRLEASSLIARIADAESSQRGFVITGDEAFLSEYEPARADVVHTFAKLRTELADEPDQLALLTQLESLAGQKFAEMDAVLAERRDQGLAPAAARVTAGRGKVLMDRMRDLSMDMLAATEQVRAARVKAYEQRIRAARSGLWVAIVVAGLLLVAAAWLFWRQSYARYRIRTAAYGFAERNRSILDSTIDAIAILNPSGTIETINGAASRMLGYAPEELKQRDVSILFDLGDDPATFHERIGLVGGKLAQPYLPDRTVRHRDGHAIPVDIALGVMSQPDGDHIVASMRDIADRKRIERLKDDLMSTVSHELRTPLTSVVGALGLLRAGSAGSLPAGAQRLIEIAENNSRRLIRLINDMLDIDRIQSGRLQLDRQPIDLRQVVMTACEGSSGLAEAGQVRIDCQVPHHPVTVAGDADRLLQVVTNLVSNAIRVTPLHGVVTVALAYDEEGGKAQVSIDDDGPGVSAEFRDRIFGRFERAQGEQSGGTGLGLAISREIVSRHDGRIWFEDRAGGGTRFAFALDLLREEPSEQGPGEGPAILIVEDDDDIAEMLRRMVGAIGHRTQRVATAAQARAALARGHYAALLLDLNLPDESGLSLAHSLRSRKGHASLPIIVVSALTRDGVTEPVPLDVVDWIEKPVDPDRLAAAVREAVRRSGARRPVVLHLDDDQDMLDIVASALSGEARVLKATDLATALAILETESPDCAILDLHLEEGSGLDLLPMLTDADGLAVPTIIFSAHDVGAGAAAEVDAVLVKSRGSLPDLRATVERVLGDRAKGAE